MWGNKMVHSSPSKMACHHSFLMKTQCTLPKCILPVHLTPSSSGKLSLEPFHLHKSWYHDGTPLVTAKQQQHWEQVYWQVQWTYIKQLGHLIDEIEICRREKRGAPLAELVTTCSNAFWDSVESIDAAPTSWLQDYIKDFLTR